MKAGDGLSNALGGGIGVRSLAASRLGFCLAVAVAIWGCGGADGPKLPLGHPDSRVIGARETETPSAMGGEAKAALDSGNLLFRAKDFDRALAQYRRSARLAPTELAPLLGILMVTDVTKNAKLADSTLLRLHELNPRAADSSASMSHADILKAHSRARKAPPPPAKKRERGTTSG
jgi:hypothetical protein